MIKFKRADHIHICVPESRLEEARDFYRDVMGLMQITRPPELKDQGIWFALADIELHIGVEETLPLTIRHTAMEITDLEAARQLLEARGVIIQKQRPIAGRNRFSFVDPFGNRMELLEYA
ncbi:VOC family protein [Mucilaginibacter ginkgonis]|uniref:Phage portal protein n=1 Tax=Mucilaginibacter ginkgonis TaxID=2682091 RepID=A0A6I4HYT2_9SPHI|nr:VOC family protein [Mucilaginibacter ginkgonis]QQL49746.1 phage portal protein [Mucilaginibacter ginkgonis]